MNLSVVWTVEANRDFARMLATADDPETVQVAAAETDRMLRRMARDLGESRSPGYRIWYGDVIGVYYRIREDLDRVEVLFAGPSRRR